MAPASPRAVDLSGLDPEQLRAATAPRGPVCIIAGAGTGKTRTITHRIAHLVDGGYVNPDGVLAVTFTSRAAAEMRERLAMMGVARVQAKTFHAAARRQLSYFWRSYAGGDLPWALLDSKYRLVSRAARRCGVEPSKTVVKDLVGEIEWAKSSLVVPEEYPARVEPDRRDCPVPPEQFVAVFNAYEQSKTTGEGILLDFDDLLLHMAAAIETNPGIADEFRSRYRSFVVDEYQDVTPLQQRVLEAWVGQRDDLTVVGDANQTIYSFNGATPRFLMDFSTRYPEAVIVRLHRDYRSTPQVVGLANDLIGRATGRIAGSRLSLEGQRAAGPKPTFEEYADPTEEAEQVVARIGQLLKRGVAASEIAVLYRINAQSESIEHALDTAGIGYQVKGGEGFFARAEVRQGMAALKAAAREFEPEEGDVAQAARASLVPVGLTPTEPTGAEERQRWQSLNALAQLVEEITTASPQLTFPTVFGMLQERASAKNPPRVEGVTLASIHAAKGLEWDAVFLVGLTDDMLPIHYATRGPGAQEAIEEERRLLYVGVTRAREHLHLSWPVARQAGGRSSRVRSRFLDDLVPNVAGDASSGAPGRGGSARGRGTGGKGEKLGAPKHACVVCGARLSTPEMRILSRCGEHALDGDQVVVEALRQWRLEQAKALGAPAYTVVTDATIRAIVQRMPTTAEELVQVPGMGPVKIERFGEDILAITRNYA
ncbi:ATP-dependent DNA helicase UvrD2 [Corynebacterium heidelbergense]|uniref:DNA 3'-5' helicase n=1 Tax=Corynebacterium heidelbergense TaxID=2055947 RepID=A0A364V4J1_9CORY|nr:ATP-dependent DNA helicase UvrD2 [Corynebacterium heidelbergense]RAV31553.1 ATP-dependent DNA helicase [Corynebacterium heidelbergense]